jgi:hypothetical protein
MSCAGEYAQLIVGIKTGSSFGYCSSQGSKQRSLTGGATGAQDEGFQHNQKRGMYVTLILTHDIKILWEILTFHRCPQSLQ